MFKAGFAISHLFHYEHLKYVSRKCPNASFILFAAERRLNTLKQEMQARGVSCYTLAEWLEQGEKIDVLFSCYWLPSFLSLGPDVLHARVMYGYAKDEWNYADWNKHYDLIFAYGPYAMARLQQYAPCVASGHPRMRMGHADTGIISGSRGSRARIVYSPTYGDLSSLGEFDEIVPTLAEHYDIVVKLHHLTSIEQLDNVQRLRNSGRLAVYGDETDLFDLMPDCDLFVSDHSGAIFDAMLHGKKIVLVNPEKTEYLISRQLHTEKASLDVKIRRVIPHGKVADLPDMAAKALNEPVGYLPMLDRLFAMQNDPPALIYEETLDRLRRFSGKNRLEPLWNKLMAFVKRDARQVVICGAGEFGEAVCHLLIRKQTRIACMVDRDPAVQNRSVYGVSVNPPDKVATLLPETHKFVVATVSGGPSYEDLLSAKGFVRGEDFICAYDG